MTGNVESRRRRSIELLRGGKWDECKFSNRHTQGLGSTQVGVSRLFGVNPSSNYILVYLRVTKQLATLPLLLVFDEEINSS
ncbi:uncharacterized [Tachysurus ichikawai]